MLELWPLCTSSHHGFSLCEVIMNLAHPCRRYGPDTKRDRRMDSQTDGQTEKSYQWGLIID